MSMAPQTGSLAIKAIADKLDVAWRTKTPIAPITETDAITDLSAAYAIQTQWTNTRLARGEKIVGRKIGLTSKAIQQQLNVGEPDYGSLWNSSYFEARNGKVRIDAGIFMQPRIEGEVAFLIGERLSGPGVTPEGILQASEACALGVEIVDSRIANWKIKLIDTIADNASYGGFTVGKWDKELLKADLANLAMKVQHNGNIAAEGISSAVMGNPAISTAWLANKLSEFSVSLEPGDIIISGGMTKMLPVSPGDEFVFILDRQPPLHIQFD